MIRVGNSEISVFQPGEITNFGVVSIYHFFQYQIVKMLGPVVRLALRVPIHRFEIMYDVAARGDENTVRSEATQALSQCKVFLAGLVGVDAELDDGNISIGIRLHAVCPAAVVQAPIFIHRLIAQTWKLAQHRRARLTKAP